MNQINQDQINIGNETAIDLLVTQNKSKAELATNLQGLGVSADANTDTLEELAYKVSTVSADTSKQKPHSLALDLSGLCDNGGDYQFGYFTEKNGWLFFRYGSTLKRRKLSAFKSSINTYGQTKTAGFQSSSIGASYDVEGSPNDKETFILNDDGSKVYIMYNSTVRVYTISGYDGTALTLTLSRTLTPKFNNSTIGIHCIDINSSETQMIVADTSGNIGIFNLTGSDTQNLTTLNYVYDDAILKFTNDSNNSIVVLYNTGSTYEINFWTVSDDQVTVVSSTSIDTGNAGNNRWCTGILKYKDISNHYKILFSFKYKDNNNNTYTKCLGVIDCASGQLTVANSKINFSNPDTLMNDVSASSPIVTIVNGNYYITSGTCFAAFDSNWNLIGYIINKLCNSWYDYCPLYTLIYDGDFYSLGEDNGTIYGYKHKLWLNKLVAYSRSVDIGNFTKMIPYFATLTEYDLDNGLYNQ